MANIPGQEPGLRLPLGLDVTVREVEGEKKSKTIGERFKSAVSPKNLADSAEVTKKLAKSGNRLVSVGKFLAECGISESLGQKLISKGRMKHLQAKKQTLPVSDMVKALAGDAKLKAEFKEGLDYINNLNLPKEEKEALAAAFKKDFEAQPGAANPMKKSDKVKEHIEKKLLTPEQKLTHIQNEAWGIALAKTPIMAGGERALVYMPLRALIGDPSNPVPNSLFGTLKEYPPEVLKNMEMDPKEMVAHLTKKLKEKVDFLTAGANATTTPDEVINSARTELDTIIKDAVGEEAYQLHGENKAQLEKLQQFQTEANANIDKLPLNDDRKAELKSKIQQNTTVLERQVKERTDTSAPQVSIPNAKETVNAFITNDMKDEMSKKLKYDLDTFKQEADEQLKELPPKKKATIQTALDQKYAALEKQIKSDTPQYTIIPKGADFVKDFKPLVPQKPKPSVPQPKTTTPPPIPPKPKITGTSHVVPKTPLPLTPKEKIAKLHTEVYMAARVLHNKSIPDHWFKIIDDEVKDIEAKVTQGEIVDVPSAEVFLEAIKAKLVG